VRMKGEKGRGGGEERFRSNRTSLINLPCPMNNYLHIRAPTPPSFLFIRTSEGSRIVSNAARFLGCMRRTIKEDKIEHNEGGRLV
jgi:hypothetical protein